MPRRSVAAQSVARIASGRAVLKPPSTLSTAAAAVWREIIAATPANHLRASDTPLLRAYCEACALADQAADQLRKRGPVVKGRTSPWLVVMEKAHRAQSSLALRLRLCPSSRLDPKTAGRAPPTPSVLPWEEEL
jgi:P27 family predicted phage terminase small subunit